MAGFCRDGHNYANLRVSPQITILIRNSRCNLNMGVRISVVRIEYHIYLLKIWHL